MIWMRRNSLALIGTFIFCLAVVSYVSLPQWIPGLTIKDIEVYRMKDSSPQDGLIREMSKQSKNNQTFVRPKSACIPVRHFAMTKIEKTGSSTLYTIFARFVRMNHQNILTQTKEWHINWKDQRHKGWEIGPEPVDVADALINHARYNKTSYDKYLHADHKWIVPIREPESWLKSAVSYFHDLVDDKDPEEVITNGTLIFKKRDEKRGVTGVKTWFHLPQLQWLGLDYEYAKDNITAITEYIDHIVPRIDMPILNEQFDASIVIMRRRFRWEYSDMFYKSYVITNSSRHVISSNARKRLLSKEVNLGEKLLYDSLNSIWWKSPELGENDFWKEVDYFKELNDNVSFTICPGVLDSGSSYHISKSRWHPAIKVNKTLCNFLATEKTNLVQDTCKYALGDLFYIRPLDV